MASNRGNVIIVDDDGILCKSLKAILEAEGYSVQTFQNGPEALAYANNHTIDVCVADLMMPGMTGIELLEALKLKQPEVEIILQTGHGSIEKAVEAIKRGAYDFLSKPAGRADLLRLVSRAMEKHSLSSENRQLRTRLDEYRKFEQVIGNSGGFRRVLNLVEQVAPTQATVLITGENGTGKEVIAKLIHDMSPRKDKPFVKVNCSALTETLLESELFGHEKGAFTGAVSRRLGRFEVADGGTLFLDEVGEIAPNIQVKLLRFLQERQFERVGSSQTLTCDVRIVAATNRPLQPAIDTGAFREDFFYRLRVIEVALPSLRERREDIPLFAHQFLQRFALRNGKEIPGFTDEAMNALVAYAWPGNVRELENSIEHAVVLARQGKEVALTTLPPSVQGGESIPVSSKNGNGVAEHMLIPFGLDMNDIETLAYEKTLAHFNGDKQRAAKSLGVSERTLYRKISKEFKDGSRAAN